MDELFGQALCITPLRGKQSYHFERNSYDFEEQSYGTDWQLSGRIAVFLRRHPTALEITGQSTCSGE
jgi:hypothetical protein